MDLLFSNRVTKAVVNRVIYRSDKLGIEPDWFMFLGEFESGLDAWKSNPYGCFSWIQFCPDIPGGDYKTIKGRRYYFSEMASMSEIELLDLSFDYLEEQQANVGRFASYHDLYLSILYPVAVGKPDDYVLNTQSNNIFDLNKNGQITVGEVKQYLDNRVRLTVPTAYWPVFFKKKTSFSSIGERSYSGHSLPC